MPLATVAQPAIACLPKLVRYTLIFLSLGFSFIECQCATEPPRYNQSPFPIIDGLIGKQKVRCLISTTPPISAIDVRVMRNSGLEGAFEESKSGTANPADPIVVQNIQMRTGDLTVNLPTVVVTDLSNHRMKTGQEIDVILGNDCLKNVVLNLTPDRVWISDQFDPQGMKYDTLPLRYEDDVPTVDVKMTGLGTRAFTIRTSSSFELHLTRPTADRLKELGRAAHCRDSFNQRLDGLHDAALVTCYDITIGSCTFQNVPAYISDSNSIGMSLLKRLRVSFDPVRKAIYVERKNYSRADWFPRNDSRYHLLFSTSSRLIVDHAIPSIPAYGAELQKNDVILLFGEKTPREMSLDDVVGYLSQSDSPVRIVYSRNGQQRETMLSIPKTYEYPPKWDKSPEEKAREFFERVE